MELNDPPIKEPTCINKDPKVLEEDVGKIKKTIFDQQDELDLAFTELEFTGTQHWSKDLSAKLVLGHIPRAATGH